MFPYENRGVAAISDNGGAPMLQDLISKFNSWYIPTLTNSSKVNRTTNYYLEMYYKQIANFFAQANYLVTPQELVSIQKKLWSFQARLRAIEAGQPDPHVTTGSITVYDQGVPVPAGGLPVPGAGGIIGSTFDELKKPVQVGGGKSIPLWMLYAGLGLGVAVLLKESGMMK